MAAICSVSPQMKWTFDAHVRSQHQPSHIGARLPAVRSELQCLGLARRVRDRTCWTSLAINLCIGLPILSISGAYPRTIEALREVALVSRRNGRCGLPVPKLAATY